MPDPTLALARRIIARPSVTPDDAGCCDLLAERLRILGFSIEFINRNGVTNLWARRGTAKPLFVFAGHMAVQANNRQRRRGPAVLTRQG